METGAPSGPIDLPTLLAGLSAQLNAAGKDLQLDKHEGVKELLRLYEPAEDELCRYKHFDKSKKYTRNLISAGETYTLMLLCWNPGMESPIHDHPCEGCWMKVICGSVVETRYRIEKDTNKLVQTDVSTADAGSVLYINDNIGLHKVSNPSADQPACTLHLYAPPFTRCSAWLSESCPADKPLKPVVTFFSEYGEVTDHCSAVVAKECCIMNPCSGGPGEGSAAASGCPAAAGEGSR